MTRDGDRRDDIGLTLRPTQEVLDLAEQHREEVWKRVSDRLKSLTPAINADAVVSPPQPTPSRPDGPERRRAPAPPRYVAPSAPRDEERRPHRGIIYAGVGVLVAVAGAIAAAIALS